MAELFDLEIPIRTTGLSATKSDFSQLEQAGTQTAARVEQSMAKLAPPTRVAEGFRAVAAASAESSSALAENIQAAQDAAVQFDAIQRRTQALAVALQDAGTQSSALARLEAAERQLAKAFQDGNLSLAVRSRINQELSRVESVLGQHRAQSAQTAQREAVVVQQSAEQQAVAADQLAAATERRRDALARQRQEQDAVAAGFRQIARDILQAKAGFDAGTLSTDQLTAALAKARQQAIALKGDLALPTAQAEAFQVIMASTTSTIAAADGAMKLIATDLKRAEAAFKAGSISAEDHALALQMARAQAIAAAQGVELAGTELTAFNTILRQTEQRTGPARQGLGTMRSSMVALAASMIGTRSTAGTLVGALLQFSIGNPLAVGVSAGLLAIIVLHEKLTEASHKAKEATDKLIEGLRKERDERIAAEHPELPFQATTAQIRARQSDLGQQLATAERGRAVPLPGGTVRIERDVEQIAKLRQEIRDLDTLQLEALRRENDAQKTLTESRRADLITLVTAGTATRADEAALRQELAQTKTELLGMSAATRATVEGRARAATLTQRITAIEGAFNKTTAQGTAGIKDQVSALTARVDLQIALGNAQGFTAERVTALQQAVAALDALQAKANLTDQQQLALLKARTEALAALTKATSATIPNQNRIGLPAVPTLRPAAPTFPTTLLPQQPLNLFGGFGDQMGGEGGSLVKAFTDAIVTGLQEAKGKVAAAIQESIIGPFAEKQALLDGIGRTMGESLKAGLTAVVTGGLTAIITGNGDVLLQSLGSILTQMGEAMVSTGIAMVGLLPALSNPFTSGPALIAAGALIAGLGIALTATATGGSGGGTSRAGGQAFAPINTTTTVGVTNTAPASTTTQSSTRNVVPVQPVTIHQTIIGVNDPVAQRQIANMTRLAAARGV